MEAMRGRPDPAPRFGRGLRDSPYRGPTQGGTTMRVLCRNRGERIVMPDIDLTLTVVAIEGSTVRLGITAPSEISVYREELWHRVCSDAGTSPRRGAVK